MHVPLDCTLRYCYNTLRKAECELMAIEFKHKGTLWRADTVQEAVALRNELEKEDKAFVPEHEQMERSLNFWSPDRFMDVIEGVGELQGRLLVAVRSQPGIPSRELLGKLHLDSEVALAGVISGLSKQLKQIGVELKDVLAIQVKWSGKTKTRRFVLDDFFLYAGIEQNWPDAWKRQREGIVAKKGARNDLADTRATRERPKTKKAGD